MKLWLQRIVNQSRTFKLQGNLHSVKLLQIFEKNSLLKQVGLGLTKNRFLRLNTQNLTFSDRMFYSGSQFTKRAGVSIGNGFLEVTSSSYQKFRRQITANSRQPKIPNKNHKQLGLAGIGIAVATTGVVGWMWHAKHSQKQLDIEIEKQLKEALGESYSNKQYRKQCEIIERLAGHHLRHRRYAAAAKLLHGALAVCREYQQQIEDVEALEKQLVEDLKKIEVAFIEKEVRVSYKPLFQEAYGINPQHKERLMQLRMNVKEKIKGFEGISPIHDEKAAVAVQKLCKEITFEVKLFLQDMISDCIHLMQTPPPCGYAFVATGSLAREEMTPYSDLEYFVLIDSNNPKHKAYFKLLTQLLEIKIIHFGETDLIKGQTLLPLGMLSSLNKGFSLDVHKNPVDEEYDLIGTPQELARYQLPEHYVEKPDNHLSGALLNCSYVSGNSECLLAEYRKEVDAFYDSLDPGTQNSLRKQRALRALEKDVEYFAPKLNLEEDTGRLFQVKDDFYRLPQTIIDALALYYDLKKNSTWERIEELLKSGMLSQKVCLGIKKVLSLAELWRLRTYDFYNFQCEFVDVLLRLNVTLATKSKTMWAGLTKQDVEELKEAYKTLISLQRYAVVFYENHGKENSFKANISNEDEFYIKGLIAGRLCQYQEAKECFELALNNNIKIYGEQSQTVVSTLSHISTVCLFLGDFKKTVEHAEKALAICFKMYNEQHPYVAVFLNNLSWAWHELGDTKKAVEYGERALAIQQKVYGEQHSATATLFSNLGVFFASIGDVKKAINCFEQALSINFKIYREPHYTIARCFGNLGSAWMTIGNSNKALDYFERALAINLKIFGEQHPALATNFLNLAVMCGDLGNIKKALEYNEKALVISINLYGEQHPVTITCFANLSGVLVKGGDIGKAIECAEKALQVSFKLFGEEHHSTARCFGVLGASWRELGNAMKALKYGEQALRIFRKLYGDQHHEVAKCFQDIGLACAALGDHKKGMEYLERSLVISLNIYGELHPLTAHIFQNLGAIWIELDDAKKGTEYGEKALKIFFKLYGNVHPDTAKCFEMLGFSWGLLGDGKKAMEYLESSLAILNKLYGPTNPRVIKISELISLLKQSLAGSQQDSSFKYKGAKQLGIVFPSPWTYMFYALKKQTQLKQDSESNKSEFPKRKTNSFEKGKS